MSNKLAFCGKHLSFCPTGPGGGVDPSCAAGGTSGRPDTNGGTSGGGKAAAVSALREAKSSLGKLKDLNARANILRHIHDNINKWVAAGAFSSKQGSIINEHFMAQLSDSSEVKAFATPEDMVEGLTDQQIKALESLMLEAISMAEGLTGKTDKAKTSKHSLSESYDLKGVDIFAEGTWNGDEYSAGDLDDLLTAFNETKDMLKPYFKLGHSDNQALISADSLPAIGWISSLSKRIKEVGGKSISVLTADISNVPKKVYELIKAGAYKRISSEIFVNAKVNGQKYPLALKAVALLGGETPAVQTLDDIHALYVVEAAVRAYEKEAETKVYQFDNQDFAANQRKEQTDMAEKDELVKQNGALESQVAELTKKLAELSVKISEGDKVIAGLSATNDALKKDKDNISKQFADTQAVLEKISDEKRTNEINTRLDKYVSDKKIVPAQRDVLFAIMKNSSGDGTKKFAVGDKEYASEESLIMAFVEASSAGLPTAEKSEVGEAQAKSTADKAKQYAEKHKVSYREALMAVSNGAKQ